MKNIYIILLAIFLNACGNDNILRVFEDTQSIEDTSAELVEVPDDAIAGYLKYSLTQVACPNCFDEIKEVDVRMESLFHLPSVTSWVSFYPEKGDCVSNLIETKPSVSQVSVGTKIDFTGGWSSGVMHDQPIISPTNFKYTTGNIPEANYNRDTWHDLYISDFQITIEDAFKSIHGFDYIEPRELLWIDRSYAFSVALFRSGMTFSWGPYGSDDEFIIIVAAYNPENGAYLGNVTCVGEDSGNMYIPEQYASQLPSGSLASVHFQRHRFGKFSFDRFPSYDYSVWVETHMSWEVIGTGYIE